MEAGRYLCPLCDKRFLSMGDKRRHLKTHTEDEE